MGLAGRCLCEGVKFELAEAPTVMGNCHCTRCQRQGSSSHSTEVLSSPDHFQIHEGADLLRTYSEEGFSDRTFCSKCGTHVYGQMGEMIFVSAAAFEEDLGIRPQFHMMVAHKAPWAEITDDLPQFPEYPPIGE